VAVLMLEHPEVFTDSQGMTWAGGLANYDGSNGQRAAFLQRYGKTPVPGRAENMQQAQQFLEMNGYPVNDWSVLTATLMLEHGNDPPFVYQGSVYAGGLANYNDSNIQALAFRAQYPNPPAPGRTIGI